MVALCLGPQGASAQTYPGVSRVEWPKTLPPRDTVVDVDTPVGRFTLPIGYVADPEIYASQKERLGTDPSGRTIYRDDKLAFKFIMPTGVMTSTALTWFYADDAAGRPDPDPNKYVVWFLDVESRATVNWTPEQIHLFSTNVNDGKLISLDGNGAKLNEEFHYRGRIDVPSTQDRIWISPACDNRSCATHFYFEREHLDFWALLPLQRREDVFKIAAKASEFLAQWTVQR